ncbi:hypothetical protein [Blastococcus xanthinilyticus]|uniref:Uncharacterized protein n=1 Tax=Blastococcus xanthinilyticus TaxID=1564164 RepID=A0A5S5CQ85_9ACTN|nr:hypothetical protein [Blastococcus xanthinilyticus]TYP83682.1 hypothetical protein BD833_11640 [Blastococcus xanthinilyticus]
MPPPAAPSYSRACARRLPLATALTAGLVLAPALPHAAAEEPAPTVRCSITDPRLAELSGLVVVGDQMLALNDGGEQVTVLGLDGDCTVIDVQTAPVDPYDPEDLAVGPDGTVWIADTGDNGADRATVALHVLRPGGVPSLYRLTYPDGPHDAEALLMAPDGTPYVVTKEVLGASGVYRPAGPLVDGGTVALERVAAVNLTLTGTPGGPVGRAGQLMVTGGAVAADGSALALRTYTDAYVWPLAGSDVAGALGGDPVHIPLPESPQGEAISFAADGKALLVASEGLPSAVTVVPLPAAAVPAVAAAEPSGPPLPSFADLARSDRSPITAALIAAAVATVVVWLGSRLRRRP